MKQVILIHAHKDLDQLNALVGILAHEDFVIYVNADAKWALDVARIAPQARLVRKRIAIRWGDYSQVRATLNSLAEIVEGVAGFDKVVFISAQDFPLLPNGALKRALDAVRGSELLDCVPVGPQGWACAERYHYFYLAGAGRLTGLACKALARAMQATGIKRQMAGGMPAYGGSSWWALSRPCIEAILARIEAEPGLERFFRTVACPDELFFQTLVMDSPFASNVVFKNYRYIAWSASGARNPKVLDAGDYDDIARSDAHFCRKLDPVASAALLPMLIELRRARSSIHN